MPYPDGLGVFTTFVVSPDKPILYLSDHYERLKRDAAFFNLAMPWSNVASMRKTIESLPIRTPVVMRISLTDKTWVHLRSLPAPKASVKLATVQYDRQFPQHKHMSRIAEDYFLRQVQAQHFDDFLRLSSAGYITETAYCNIFFVLPDSRLYTPCPQQAGCLPGIARKAILNQGIPVEEGCFSTDILSEAVGAFVTNAVRGIVPVSQIDDQMFDVEWVQSLLGRFAPSPQP